MSCLPPLQVETGSLSWILPRPISRCCSVRSRSLLPPSTPTKGCINMFVCHLEMPLHLPFFSKSWILYWQEFHMLFAIQQHGITVKHPRCVLMQDSVVYIGHRVDGEGLHTTDHKVEAVCQVPQPRNVCQFRAFLGMLENLFLT